ncbi:hypothetical protein HK405_003225, partial [Cladochytrium tenue]
MFNDEGDDGASSTGRGHGTPPANHADSEDMATLPLQEDHSSTAASTTQGDFLSSRVMNTATVAASPAPSSALFSSPARSSNAPAR